MEHPERWAILESLPNDPNGKVRSLCHIAYSEHGLVGIDISSHQGSNTDTIRALVEEMSARMQAAGRHAPAIFLRMFGGRPGD